MTNQEAYNNRNLPLVAGKVAAMPIRVPPSLPNHRSALPSSFPRVYLV